MARIKLEFESPALFKTNIIVRIADINYGGHLGNDSLLSMIHEARILFYKSIGVDEIKFFNCSMIMADVAIMYKHEGFHNDSLQFEITVTDFTNNGFDLQYRITKKINDQEVLVAIAKTGMVCFNYENKKIQPVPIEFIDIIKDLKNK